LPNNLKRRKKWLIKLILLSALLAVHARLSALLRQSLKAQTVLTLKLMQISALIAAVAQLLALAKLSPLPKREHLT
jgi:hypothetical protein